MYMIINYESFLDFQYRPSVATRETVGIISSTSNQNFKMEYQ